jgi:hypothetical protein
VKKLVIVEFFILLIGTLFAWSNFGYELYSWLNNQECTLGCAQGLVNPFLTPCFYGACFFTLAFVLSAVMLKKVGK